MADGSYDDLLLGLAQKHKGIDDILYSIFSFFERRTDLFHVIEEGGDTHMGFRPGVAEQMVQKQFRVFQKRYLQRAQPHLLRAPEEGTVPGPRPPPSALAAEVGGEGDSVSSSVAAEATAPSPPALASPPSNPNTRCLPDGVTASEEDGGTGGPASKFQHISTWNGATTEKYKWSQSIYDCTVEIEVEACKARDIKVDLTSTRLSVKCKNKLMLEGKLHEKVNTEDSLWSLDDSTKIVLHLEKMRETWWRCILEGDDQIDTTKVESTRGMDEYDGETQGAIRKIMFDQSQKVQGKPTSDQLRTAEIMKGAWNAPGSPFRGTDYDPTLLNLQGSVPEEFFADVEKRKLEEAERRSAGTGDASVAAEAPAAGSSA